MCCKCCGPTQRKVWVFGSGALLLLFGVLTICLWPNLADSIIQSKLVLSRDSESFDMWSETPIPIIMQFVMFNWTNPDQLREKGVKPNFVEMGPYSFLEKARKEDIQFNENNTVSYYANRTWFFLPDQSNGTLDDIVTSPNMISATIASEAKDKSNYQKIVFNHLLETEGGSLLNKKTVREWLFDGFYDRLLDFSMRLNITDFDTFGWFYNRNGSKTYEGHYTIRTGKDDITKMGQLTHWNGEQHTPFYEDECGKVNGSMGDLWAPNVDTTKQITVFSSDLCRYFNLMPGEKMSKHGIDGVEWVSTAESFGNADKYPNMKCFCPSGKDECPPSGLLDVSSCRDNAPIYVSFPHFNLADPWYRESITGMNPIDDKHRFKFAIEPSLGVPLKAYGTLQINLLLQPVEKFTFYEGIPKFVAPLFYFIESGELNEELAKELRFVLNLPTLGRNIGIGIASLGAAIILVGLTITFLNKWGGTEKKIN